MEVILLESIRHVGSLGERVVVKDGYARNYLIPTKKAMRLNKDSLAFFEARKAELAANNEAAKKVAETIREKIAGKSFIIIRQAGDSGHLYGSVTTRDVAAAMKAGGIDIDYTSISIDKPIKDIGIYHIRATLHSDVVETIKVNVARTEEEAVAAEEKVASNISDQDNSIEPVDVELAVASEEVVEIVENIVEIIEEPKV